LISDDGKKNSLALSSAAFCCGLEIFRMNRDEWYPVFGGVTMQE
jgi:hypothetical protein